MSQLKYADLRYCRELDGLFSDVDSWWIKFKDEDWQVFNDPLFYSDGYKNQLVISRYPAITTDDLLKKLPKSFIFDGFHIFRNEPNFGWCIQFALEGDEEDTIISDKKFPNALAKLLIYLKDNGLIGAEKYDENNNIF